LASKIDFAACLGHVTASFGFDNVTLSMSIQPVRCGFDNMPIYAGYSLYGFTGIHRRPTLSRTER
jgi:hypothetical protein